MTLHDMTIDTNNLEAAHLFYVRLLGLPVLSHSDTHLRLLISNTRLTFQRVNNVSTPRQVTINVLLDSLPVFMEGYAMHHLVAQTPQTKNSPRPEGSLSRSQFYDPMGNFIELIPHGHLAIQHTIPNLGVVQHLEEHQVLVYA